MDIHDADGYVFESLRLRGVFISHWQLGRDWALEGGQEACALLHYMLEGEAAIEAADGMSYRLGPGDLAVLPHGQRHRIARSPALPAVAIDALLPQRESGRLLRLRTGGPGRHGEMLCAGLHYRGDAPALRHLQQLPPLLVLKAADIEAQPLLAHALRGLGKEIDGGRGRGSVLLRGLELVYQLAIDVAYEAQRLRPGLRDPRIGRALSAIEDRYAESWTLQTLAREASMSRSAFAPAFKRLVGETPMQRLARRRLEEARHLLTATALPFEAIAAQVGYGSAVGLHLAFRKHYGMTPGAVRRAASADPSRA